ncbi:uncharacterized protein BP01DRAFT_304288 [Aspergillus saccharolyticus JOP 1030-1]|uniref:Ribonucleases P/MRP subunit Pop8-like domain-containing protein n=1 Tax=Aspergillus saccharolyticus JOP 1030-1 TaxID=1450539 RepID=A0A319A3J0_9EURO|nr:hypothetical protein BP01DRAFT_304288 [Aspergillus saccharolyticus JOP 1030-1]PYH42022.1 hypothetical protein BP01DRAFT_304288 [Aspergillus saccharolyticus JOP 1030-1]
MSTTSQPQPAEVETAKRKAPTEQTSSSSTPAMTFTTRSPPWTYLKLQLTHQPPVSQSTLNHPLDPLTARTYLSAALRQFLGLSGTAIAIDILKIDPPSGTNAKTIWIRVPEPDASAVVAALSSWVGGSEANGNGNVAWRVCAKGNFLQAIVNGSGAEIFVP